MSAPRGRHLVVAGLVAAVLCAGCTSPQIKAVRERGSALPPRVELRDVPFFPQKRYQCGPAALATTLRWSGEAVEPAALVSEVYLPARKGTLQVELLGAARRRGFVPYVLAPRFTDLLTEVAGRHPVLVLQNLGLEWAPAWHYAVVVGYDLKRERIVLRSGTHRRHVISFQVFERTWRRGDYWAVVILPPGEMPLSAEPARYVKAVSGLERVKQWQGALRAYSAAWRRWPGSLPAGLGVGNVLVASERLREAEQAFRTLTERHPRAGVAFNNLAHVLALQGRLEEAERVARRAVSLGGTHQQTSEQTLREIRERRGRID